MYVCICNPVTDHDIRRAVAQGCHSMRQLREQTGVAAECGRCAKCARHVLEAALQEQKVQAHAPTYATLALEAV